jgi:hypothetical protein
MIRTERSITFEHQEFTAPNTQRFPSILQSDINVPAKAER